MLETCTSVGPRDQTKAAVIGLLAERAMVVYNSEDDAGMHHLATITEPLTESKVISVVKYRWGNRSRQYIVFILGRPVATFIEYGAIGNAHHYTSRMLKKAFAGAAEMFPAYAAPGIEASNWVTVYNLLRAISGEQVNTANGVGTPGPFEDIHLPTVRNLIEDEEPLRRRQ